MSRAPLPFGLFGLTGLAGIRRTPVTQVETPDLGRRDIDIVGSRQVIIVGGSQKPETVGQDFQRAFAENEPVFLFDPGLK